LRDRAPSESWLDRQSPHYSNGELVFTGTLAPPPREAAGIETAIVHPSRGLGLTGKLTPTPRAGRGAGGGHSPSDKVGDLGP
jgi:hypothetical protein